MRKILIVEDAAFMRLILKDIITQGGFTIAGEAIDGEEAIELYQQTMPDLVTMDITMPKQNGITALKKILEIDPNAKVIVCSAMAQQAMVIESIQAGAKDFILKPFKPQRVIESVNKFIN